MINKYAKTDKKRYILAVVFSLRISNANQNLIFFSFSGSLSIKDSQETDQGDYECVAENSKGTEYSYEAKLYVRGRWLLTLWWTLF